MQGILIHAGGSTYLTNAYVASRMLRWVGCKLPLEWWIKDKSESTRYMARCAEEVGARIINASQVARKYDHPDLPHFARKPYSIYHSEFSEVMLLDADVVPVRDPTYLFRDREYRERGSLFWPDISKVPADSPFWKAACIAPDPGPVFQGGQQIINKDVCSRELEVAVDINFDHAFWYKLTYGEQDTYRAAWNIVGTPYGIIPVPPKHIRQPAAVIIEHDRLGRRVFQHRCGDKWKLEGENVAIPDFWFEDRCRGYLDDLREIIENSRRRELIAA